VFVLGCCSSLFGGWFCDGGCCFWIGIRLLGLLVGCWICCFYADVSVVVVLLCGWLGCVFRIDIRLLGLLVGGLVGMFVVSMVLGCAVVVCIGGIFCFCFVCFGWGVCWFGLLWGVVLYYAWWGKRVVCVCVLFTLAFCWWGLGVQFVPYFIVVYEDGSVVLGWAWGVAGLVLLCVHVWCLVLDWVDTS